jgi:phage tail sheath gpL-like
MIDMGARIMGQNNKLSIDSIPNQTYITEKAKQVDLNTSNTNTTNNTTAITNINTSLTSMGNMTSVSAVSNIYTLNIANQATQHFHIETIADTKKVITATVVGTITTAGNATIIVTAVGLTGSPKTYSVAVTSSNTATTVAGKIITVLQADSVLTTLFTVGGTGTTITLTNKTIANNDSTENINITNGTCTGLTSSPTSVITVGSCANKSIALTNILPSAFTQLTIELKYTNSVATMTYPTSFVWLNGIVPTFTVGQIYYINLISSNGGTTIRASFMGGWLL